MIIVFVLVQLQSPFNFPCMEEKSSGYEGLPVKKEKSETNYIYITW